MPSEPPDDVTVEASIHQIQVRLAGEPDRGRQLRRRLGVAFVLSVLLLGLLLLAAVWDPSGAGEILLIGSLAMLGLWIGGLFLPFSPPDPVEVLITEALLRFPGGGQVLLEEIDTVHLEPAQQTLRVRSYGQQEVTLPGAYRRPALVWLRAAILEQADRRVSAVGAQVSPEIPAGMEALLGPRS